MLVNTVIWLVSGGLSLFLDGLRRFQIVSGWFQVILAGFRWFQVVPRLGKYIFLSSFSLTVEVCALKCFPIENSLENLHKKQLIFQGSN